MNSLSSVQSTTPSVRSGVAFRGQQSLPHKRAATETPVETRLGDRDALGNMEFVTRLQDDETARGGFCHRPRHSALRRRLRYTSANRIKIPQDMPCLRLSVGPGHRGCRRRAGGEGYMQSYGKRKLSPAALLARSCGRNCSGHPPLPQARRSKAKAGGSRAASPLTPVQDRPAGSVPRATVRPEAAPRLRDR